MFKSAMMILALAGGIGLLSGGFTATAHASPAGSQHSAEEPILKAGNIELAGTDRCLIWSNLKKGAVVNSTKCEQAVTPQQTWVMVLSEHGATFSPGKDANLYLSTSLRGSKNAQLEDIATLIRIELVKGGYRLKIGDYCLSATTRGTFTIPTWQPCGQQRWLQIWRIPERTITFV